MSSSLLIVTSGLAGGALGRGLEFGKNARRIGAERRHLQAVADRLAVPFYRQRGRAERRAVGIERADQAALALDMRIVEQVFGAVDRREADVEPVQRRRQRRDISAS